MEDSVRQEFVIFRKYNFLDWACMSPSPISATKAVSEFLRETNNFGEKSSSLQYVKFHEKAKEMKQEIAELLSSAPEEIAITGSSTTQGVQIAFESIKPEKGDNIVTCDLEFTLAGAELQKWKEKGVEIRVAKHKNGIYNLEDFVNLVDDRTRIIYLDSVNEINGYRLDIGEISRLIHEHGGYIVLDSIQHIGAIELNAREANIDFIAAGGHKWLTSPFGIGFLYVNRKIMNELIPPFYGYMNMRVPEEGWDKFFRNVHKNPITDYSYDESATKFEYGGTPPFAAIYGLNESLKLTNRIGIRNIQHKILRMRKGLAEELEELRVKIISPLDERHSSGILSFNLSGDIKDDYRLTDELYRNKIMVSCRGASGIGGVRVSMHYPNSNADLKNLVKSIKAFKKGY